MDVDEAADRLRHLLTAEGFDTDRPNPAVAWAAFKRFVAEPMDVRTTELWFEAADGDPAADSPAYFDFVRVFMHDQDDGVEWGEQVTAHFTASPDARPGLLKGHSVHAEDVSELELWFAAVEASPTFRAGAEFVGWSFEVRIDGC